MENLYFCASGPCPSLGTCLPHCFALAVLGIVLLAVGVVPSSPHPQPWDWTQGPVIFSPTVLFIFIILKNNYSALFASRKFYSVDRAGLELLSGQISASLVLGLLSWPPPACPAMGFYLIIIIKTILYIYLLIVCLGLWACACHSVYMEVTCESRSLIFPWRSRALNSGQDQTQAVPFR